MITAAILLIAIGLDPTSRKHDCEGLAAFFLWGGVLLLILNVNEVHL